MCISRYRLVELDAKWTLNRDFTPAHRNEKSLVPVAAQGFSWSCYPDLNWRPHPYQRRRKNISKQKHHKTKNFRRAIQLLRRQKIAAGGPGPLFFHALQRLLALDLIPMPRRACERRQFPRGHAPGPDSPSAGNCHGAEPTFGPALRPGHDNHPPVLSWRATPSQVIRKPALKTKKPLA